MDWREGLGCLLRDLGLCLKIVAALLVAWAGVQIFDEFTNVDKWWAFFPVILGGALMLAGAAAAALLLWQRVVRVKFDVASKSAAFAPVHDERPTTGVQA